MLTMMEPISAAQMLSTWKLMLNQLIATHEDSQRVKALITIRNNPMVTTMQPHDKNFRMGLMSAFTRPRIIAIIPKAIQAFVPDT